MSDESKPRKEKFVPLESEQFTTRFSEKRSKRKKHFQRLALAHFDIHSAYDTCELFLEKVAANNPSAKTAQVGLSNPLYLPLLEAMIISYTRPFIDNDSLGVLPKQWSEFEDKELKEAHRFILQYRNELVAHSDHTVRKIQIFSPTANFITPRQGKKMQGPGFAVSNFWIPLHRVETFHRLFAFQGKRMMDHVMDLLDELYGRMELPDKAFKLRDGEGL